MAPILFAAPTSRPLSLLLRRTGPGSVQPRTHRRRADGPHARDGGRQVLGVEQLHVRPALWAALYAPLDNSTDDSARGF
jgi:hypothetical protein